ncbi:MAG: hypothetical protein AAB865_02045 [Patescibacteria group bacterium]
MPLTDRQQLTEMIKRSTRPLLVLPEHAGVDHFSAAFGLHGALKKLDKAVTIVTSAPTPKSIATLSDHPEVFSDIPSLHDLVIEVDLSANEMEAFKHHTEPGKLKIHLTPKAGMWKQEHVTVSPSQYRYDLVICLGAQDLASCGQLFQTYPDFFFKTPILNIDHSPANEHFGHVNAVNVTATSCGEVCHEILLQMDPALLDEHIATHFLRGMISKTKSFKTRNVTPKTLEVASQLLEAGARREEIIHHLYRTRSVATLRLWGRVLARLKTDETRGLVWSLLSAQDFVHAGAEEADLPEVIDELIAMSPEANTIVLLYENKEHAIVGIVRTHPPVHATEILKTLSPKGNNEEAHIHLLNTSLIEAERRILELIPMV